ncbi:hypothetical protein [Olleya sp. Hel_I_94]|uniref:hypothetical protein n=1 Tax=Olleya sp. Hel_I_94 TaxID=1250001 RepID=UPI0011A0BFFF|nr:hypothetical protein [Olleya sp. Hel_I_94]TVZ48651.1 hypothetical protein JM82_3301 [Olleya sp. Hel_I_94]
MTKNAKKIIIAIEIIVLIISIIWLINAEEFEEPLIVLLVSISALIGTFFVKSKEEKKEKQDSKTTLSQKAGKKSNQYMSKGDMTIKK